tara:strand:- start:1960 stop:3108 length:1149 start_codon:yes stop_codon:yes gene_type:complete
MKKTIYKYIFHEFLRYFAISLFALSVIAWTIQAVNYLDLITEDGHAFKIYFYYSLLTLSKVLTKLVPICFLAASVLTILKMEKDNELIALWTSGVNKILIVNLIFKISLIIMLVQLFLTIFLNPTTLNFSRTILKTSDLQFIPSLLKERQFNDTVKKLTIFVDKKNDDDIYENIFIRDEGKILTDISEGSSTIIAKTGYITENENKLVLLNGYIQKVEKETFQTSFEGQIKIIKFDKTVLNLSGISTKSISEPKIQETSTFQLIKCLQVHYLSMNEKLCPRYKKDYRNVKIEINKRFGMPFFIPLISLICSFLLISKKNKRSFLNKYIYIFFSFAVLVFAELSVRYSGISWNHTTIYYLLPAGMLPIIYFTLIKTFKHENLS